MRTAFAILALIAPAAALAAGPEAVQLTSKVSVEHVRKDSDRDFIMSAAEAKQYGMIDEVLTSRKLAEVADSRVMELVEPGNFPDGHATDGS